MLAVVIVAEWLVAFCVLGFEIAVARLAAPYVGTSTDTWTAIIAAFLLALALGNVLAGHVASRVEARRTPLLAAMAAATAGVLMMETPHLIASLDALIVAPAPLALWRIVLFFVVLCLPCGLLLGLATPLLMTTALALSGNSGRVVGAVYAMGALGSVAGVLAVLWVLLDRLGTAATIIFLGGVAVGTAAMIGLAMVARLHRTAWA